MRKNTSNIFESVRFLNEGIISALSLVALPIALLTVAVTCQIKDNTTRKAIGKLLEEELNNNEDLLSLKEKMKKGVRVISVDDLAKKVKISNKDKEIIETNDVVVLELAGNNDDIIAYCLTNDRGRSIQYGYSIVDKSLGNSKKIKTFIQALFEFKLGIYGDALKKIAPMHKCRSFSADSDINAQTLSSKANYLSEEQYKDWSKKRDEFHNELYKKLKTSVSTNFTVKNDDEYDRIIVTDDKLIKDYENTYDDNKLEKLEKEHKKVYKQLNDKLHSILDQFEFGSSNNKYKLISVEIEEEPDVIACFYINIGLKKNKR